MNTEYIKQRLIAELNENSMLLYAERQKLKAEHLPIELLEEMLRKNRKSRKLSKIFFGVLAAFLTLLIAYSRLPSAPNLILQSIIMQFMPLLGIIFFSASYQNYGKRIFILELLLHWDDQNN